MFIHFEWIIICPVHTYGFMKKLKFLFFPTILVLAFGLMLSCAKSSEDNINGGVANTNENLVVEVQVEVVEMQTTPAHLKIQKLL